MAKIDPISEILFGTTPTGGKFPAPGAAAVDAGRAKAIQDKIVKVLGVKNWKEAQKLLGPKVANQVKSITGQFMASPKLGPLFSGIMGGPKTGPAPVAGSAVDDVVAAATSAGQKTKLPLAGKITQGKFPYPSTKDFQKLVQSAARSPADELAAVSPTAAESLGISGRKELQPGLLKRISKKLKNPLKGKSVVGESLGEQAKNWMAGKGGMPTAFKSLLKNVGLPLATVYIANSVMGLMQQFQDIENTADIQSAQIEAEAASAPTIRDEIAKAMFSQEQQKGQVTHQAALQAMMGGLGSSDLGEAVAGPAPSTIPFRQPVE